MQLILLALDETFCVIKQAHNSLVFSLVKTKLGSSNSRSLAFLLSETGVLLDTTCIKCQFEHCCHAQGICSGRIAFEEARSAGMHAAGMHEDWKFVLDLKDSGGDRSHDSIVPHSGLSHRGDSRWDVYLQAFVQHHQTR